MQKKIIALAIASAMVAPAMAFADGSVYGIVDAALVNTTADTYKSSLQVLSGGLSTSRLGFNASEDLGNGMKAFGNLEYGLELQNNSLIGYKVSSGSFYARQQAVGLSGDFGTVRAGYLQDAGYYWAGKFDPTAGSLVDSVAATNPSAGSYINTGARINSAIDYTSPNMSGFSVAISHSFNTGTSSASVPDGSTTGNRTSVNVMNAMYEAGPLAVGFAYAQDSNDNAAFNKTTDMALGGSFDLEAAKLYATYQTHKTDAAGYQTDKGMSLSAVAPVGGDQVVATVAKYSIGTKTATADDKTGITLAYLHNMSKMTTLYGAVQRVSNGMVNAAATDTVDVTNLAVGLRYKF